MNGPVDRVENAAIRYDKPDKVRRAAESAKEKDQKFTKILKEKFEEDLNEKRKQKKRKDEVILQNISNEEAEETVDLNTQAGEESASDQDDHSDDDSKAPTVEHVDLKA